MLIITSTWDSFNTGATQYFLIKQENIIYRNRDRTHMDADGY